jgi:hypothetical protein
VKNKVYGVKRNLTFEEQLKFTLGEYGRFTTKEAVDLYQQYHPGDTALPGMNAKGYLASAVNAGVIRRVKRGVYEFV